MPSKKDQPAAPVAQTAETFTTTTYTGFTKREAAATSALAGLASNPHFSAVEPSEVAARAWALADALLDGAK